MKQTRTLPKQLGRAEIIPASFNADDNTLEVVFATEVSVLRRTREETYQEILVCRTPNVGLERLNVGGAAIDTYSPGSIRNQFGVVVRAWVDDATVTINIKMKRTNKEIADIFAACRAAGLTSEYADTLVAGDLSTADALAEIKTKRSAAPAPVPAPAAASTLTAERATIQAEEHARITGIRTAARTAGPGTDEKDKKTRGIEAKILQRAGAVSAEASGDPGEYRGMRMLDLAAECLTIVVGSKTTPYKLTRGRG